MIDSETRDNVRNLDPFGFWIGHASAIRPLGGEQRGPDPRYAFHTPYVEHKPGRVVFTIRFEELRATFGELRVFINAFVPGSGRDAVLVTSSLLNLADRGAAERGLVLSILSVPGASYAAYGFCPDGTDAHAAALSVTAELVSTTENVLADGLLPTRLGAPMLQHPSRLVGDDMPSFGDPVSQPMTEDQLVNPDYRRWSAMLGGAADGSTRWKLAFVAQALDRYGMLREGAAGIGLGEKSEVLGPIISAAGGEAVQALLAPDPEPSGFNWSALPCIPLGKTSGLGQDGCGRLLSLADLPADQRGFDFLWSIDLAGIGHQAGRAAAFLIDMMAVLRPGGYAVHMFDLATRQDARADALPRAAVERLAVTLISRGFTVAQLNFGGIDAAHDLLPFGLIVRKS